MSIENIETHTLLPELIVPDSIVLDCGANIGSFSVEMIRRFGCSCYAIEAAPDTFKRIPTIENLHRYQFAVCELNKPVNMTIDQDPERSSIQISKFENIISVQGRNLADFVSEELGEKTIDVLKMD